MLHQINWLENVFAIPSVVHFLRMDSFGALNVDRPPPILPWKHLLPHK